MEPRRGERVTDRVQGRRGEAVPPRPVGHGAGAAGRPVTWTAPPRARPAPPLGRRLLRQAKVALVVLSALVVLVTGLGWSAYRQLGGGLSTSDVLDHGGAPDGSLDILLVGMDSRTDAQGNPLPRQVLQALHAGPDTGELNTDTLILVHIPNDTRRRAVAISLPRDSYVDIPGFGMHKINSAYQRGAMTAEQRLRDEGVTGPTLDQLGRQAGRRTLIQTVEQLTGISVDHYAEINLAGFYEITQAVGGVPVCLKAPARDSYSGVDLPAGLQTLQGAQALAFVRQRHGLPRGDLDRIVRQQAFMAGLTHKVLSAGTLADPATLSSLLAAVKKYVVIDQGWDLAGFAQQAAGMSGGAIAFETIPTGRPDLPTPSDGQAVEVDPQQVADFVRSLTGLPPETPSATPPLATPSSPVSAVADVRNASGVTGLAARVLGVLTGSGFSAGETGNAAPRTHSVIRYGSGASDAAQQAADALGGLPTAADSALDPGHVEVLLGADYAGPGYASAGAAGSGYAGSGAAGSGYAGSGYAGSGYGVADTTPSPGPTSAAPPSPPLTGAGVPCVN